MGPPFKRSGMPSFAATTIARAVKNELKVCNKRTCGGRAMSGRGKARAIQRRQLAESKQCFLKGQLARAFAAKFFRGVYTVSWVRLTVVGPGGLIECWWPIDCTICGRYLKTLHYSRCSLLLSRIFAFFFFFYHNKVRVQPRDVLGWPLGSEVVICQYIFLIVVFWFSVMDSISF